MNCLIEQRQKLVASMMSENFEAPVCHNRGAKLETPFRGQCGQKHVKRLEVSEIRAEI